MLVANFGCHLFSKSKKPAVPKESTTPAADDEKDFMQRWIDKRTTELVTQGMTAGTARANATAEFKARYSYLDVVQRSK